MRKKIPDPVSLWAKVNHQAHLIQAKRRKPRKTPRFFHKPISKCVTIVRYKNRKLYLTYEKGSHHSKYIQHDYLFELIRHEIDFTVMDFATKEDITQSVLTAMWTEIQMPKVFRATPKQIRESMKKDLKPLPQ
jgi:hypothetical protein